MVGWVGVGWVAGSNDNITNSAKLKLELEFGNYFVYSILVPFQLSLEGFQDTRIFRKIKLISLLEQH